MPNYLIFHLYGPMQSWGEIAVGEARNTAAHPTKSAIMGLLAAALGLKRDAQNDPEHQKLFHTLNFAVRIDASGSLLRDYHTTQLPRLARIKYATRRAELLEKDLSTVLSKRDYRCDAVYTIALWPTAESYDLERLAQALKKPTFTLSLGRKACPLALPLQPLIYQADHLVAAFAQAPYPPLLLSLLPKDQTEVDIYWEGEDEQLKLRPKHQNQRRDGLVSRQRWQFSDRIEYYTTIPRTAKKEG